MNDSKLVISLTKFVKFSLIVIQWAKKPLRLPNQMKGIKMMHKWTQVIF